MFIEDEKSIVDLYKIYLEKHGYEFYSTYDIDEAKSILKTKNIDAIVLDIIIRKKEAGGMINVVAEQGYTFLEKIRKEESLKNIPIIMFSNLNTDQDRAKAKKLGASDYIFKGNAKPQDLINAINRVI
ncbi:MAG: response regulator [Patescibacteria group bacterium]|nr:response regulator [Patescibacteria group bacterium]